MSRIVGIDLGTTNSVIAVVEGREPTVIPMAEGSRLCPSVVGFTRTGDRLVGQLARRQAVASPDRTIASVKRHMGVSEFVQVDGRNIRPQEISACILHKLKTDAEAFLGEKVGRAVITVPAYFSDAQRQATKDAGAIAGLEVVRIINEPTAAALAYGIGKTEAQNVLVWDLGGGTFDVSILELSDGLYEVRATCGDTMLGGDDWDQRLMEWLAGQFQILHNIDVRRDRMAMQRLNEAAEKAKIELSNLLKTNINLPFLSSGPDGPLHLDIDLTRSQMEALCADLLERLKAPTLTAIRDSGMKVSQLDQILLVGGSTRMPAVQELVRQLFGKAPLPYSGLDPDEAVARGAALQAGVLGAVVDNVLLLDVTPLSLGIETVGGVVSHVIARNTTLPTQAKQLFTTSSDGQTVVNFRVYQGETRDAANSKLLGNFQLSGIPRAPRGIPQIEVTFDVDVNGILHVDAVETNTGIQQQIKIGTSSAMARSEIDALKVAFTS